MAGIPVVALIRVSKGSQAAEDKLGIPAQKAVIGRIVKEYDLQVTQWLEIIDVSGKDVLLTPEIGRIVDLMQRGTIKGVVTREFSRLMRPQKFGDWMLLQAFQENRCALYLPDGPIDFSTRSGKLVGGIKAMIAGDELETIRDRLYEALEEHRAKGGRCASVLPLGVGYTKQRGWFYDDDQGKASRVREAYDAVLKGESLRSIAASLLNTSPTGAKVVIQNPIYKGWRVYDKQVVEERPATATTKKYHIKGKRPAERIIRVKVIDEPLVSPEKWERANEILRTKVDQHYRERQGTPTAYNGFVFCDECGSGYSPRYRRNNGVKVKAFYSCLSRCRPASVANKCKQPNIPQAELEAQVDRLLGGELTSPAFIRRLAMKLHAKNDDPSRNAKLARLEKELHLLQTTRARILDNYEAGEYSKAQRDKKLAANTEAHSKVAAELETTRATMLPALPLEQLARIFKVFAGWNHRTRDERRKLLSVTVPRMRVRDGRIVSFYRLLDRAEMAVPDSVMTATTGASAYLLENPTTNGFSNSDALNRSKQAVSVMPSKPGRKPGKSLRPIGPGVWIDLVA